MSEELDPTGDEYFEAVINEGMEANKNLRQQIANYEKAIEQNVGVIRFAGEVLARRRAKNEAATSKEVENQPIDGGGVVS
jgi:hypothetical protein